ncbi:TetR/AcrR family transcriptional regulator [Rikenella microfusus]|uniref:Mycofactocin system transcriptional regulator n=1 Tax=Rikenella microfusus TaxID=28139 RepID=A0A379MPK2_9BACT|nr:TetR/AcrR family transcriptional regulator [Rikenella microfusus]SUE33396.1 mycofactocin system transcriptional regulator [Rikenella microfusus]
METEGRNNESGVRQRIIALADELFPAYGVRSVSMDQIASRLSMSRRALGRYFPDKQELLLAWIDYHGAMMKARADEIGGRAETVLHAVLEIYREQAPKVHRISPRLREDLCRYPKAVARLEKNRSEQAERMLRFFRTGVGQGIFLPGLNYGMLGRTLARMLDTFALLTLAGRYAAAETYGTALLTLVRGACTAKGLRIFGDCLPEYRA